jgi:Protein of unknown function (DUF2867)
MRSSPSCWCRIVDGGSRLRQIATFVPRGLWGRLYWYGVLPFHRFVFPGLVHGLAEAAEAEPEAEPERDVEVASEPRRGVGT